MKQALFVLFISCFTIPIHVLATSYDVEIFAVVPGCGDGVIQAGEQCDGSNLGGASCSLQGFTAGSLSCSTACTFITASCFIDESRGVGSESTRFERENPPFTPVTDSNVIISGYFEPAGRVSILKDGILSGTTFADASGRWQLTLSGLVEQTYLFQVIGTSYTGTQVYSETFFTRVLADATTKVSAIVLAPQFLIRTIDSKTILETRAIPDSRITVLVDGREVIYYAVPVDYDDSIRIDLSSFLLQPTHTIAVAVSLATKRILTPEYLYTKNSEPAATPCTERADVSKDCQVNFIDFLIARAWYLVAPITQAFDLDQSGRIDLVDFSIMAYYWTG
jgi:hypothetical protein